jgi:hypothetical protein
MFEGILKMNFILHFNRPENAHVTYQKALGILFIFSPNIFSFGA